MARKPKNPDELTPLQARFVVEYPVDLNGTKAAERAGASPRSAAVTAAKWLRKANVRAAIDAELERRKKRVQVTADEVLLELKRLALVDIGQAFGEDGRLKKLHEMPEDVRRAIAGIEVDEIGGEDVGVGLTRKVKFWSKTESLVALGKHLKLFTDKVEHSGTLTLEQLVAESMGSKS